MFHVYRSNRLEQLAAALAQRVAAPLASPWQAEQILVQSNGMARWLSLQLAQEHGVCANVAFEFPGSYFWKLFQSLEPDVPTSSGFDPAALTWRLFALLPELRSQPEFRELGHYLGEDDPLARFELARRLADVFDQYLVYRPDWIAAWEAGSDSHWQAQLWRLLAAAEPLHRARLLMRTAARLREGRLGTPALPERLCVFGIASLPQPQLDLLSALAGHCELHLFLLDPSEQYWGAIRSEREQHRLAAGADPAALYLESGNRLLASLGRQGRDFAELLLDYDPHEYELYREAESENLLGALQADILALRNRGEDGERSALAADDDSLQVHSCHSRMREIEVLYDRLLALFAADATLTPADVAVMTPDIEAYAPYVDAVFAAAQNPRIPYAIADRSVRQEAPVVACFLRLLELRESRFQADSIAALLEVAALRERFGIAEADLTTLHEWIRASNIRWGVDEQQRAALDLPPERAHSWRAGLERMLLGYALPGEGLELFGGILPFDEIEGGAGELAGRLVEFIEALFELPAMLAAPRTPAAWRETLNGLLERFFAAGEADQAALQNVRQALDELVAETAHVPELERIPLSVVLASLQRRLESATRSGSFLSGAVTFCAMVPMRSIPFKVVCLLGMNDGDFPRQQRPLGFDLMAAQPPRRGDRSRRFEDRHLFLEALLSARRCFYVSYVGQSIRDNSSLPPSVVVDELLDYIEQGWQTSGAPTIREQLVTRHRLQAFSPAYFGAQPRLFTYAAELESAAALVGRGERESVPLVTEPLPEPGAEWRTLELERLIDFWCHPARFLLRRRLGLSLEEQGGLLPAREPFLLDNLQRWQLRAGLLDLCLHERAPAAHDVAAAAGWLPHGSVGRQALAQNLDEVQLFAAQVRAHAETQPMPAQAFTFELGGFQLSGSLDRLGDKGRSLYRLGKDRGKDLLALWIGHLLPIGAGPVGVPRCCRGLRAQGELTLPPLQRAAAEAHLRRLLEGYWQGLLMPLPFFARSSYAYAQAAHKLHTTGKGDPAAAARKAWGDSEQFAGGDCRDPYVALAFAETDPLADPRFAELAEYTFAPLFAATEEVA